MTNSQGSSTPEERIRAAVSRGDLRDALRFCSDEYGPAIGRTAMAMLGSQSDAEEVAQETLLAAYRGFSSFEARGSVRSWLFGIARNLCLKRLASATRTQRKLQHLGAVEPAQPADARHDLRQRGRVARLALEQIRPSEREALLLRYVAELPYSAIADTCNIDEPAARKRVSRALSKLRQIVEEMEKA